VDHVSAPRPVTRLGLWLQNPISTSDGRAVLDNASAVADSAERAGFDSLWVSDRVFGIDDRPGVARGQGGGHARYEAYSLLGALSTRTRSIRLGAIPVRPDIRAPSILTKIVTCIDVISHGRGVVTLGLDTEDGVTGVNRLEEALQVCRAMLDDEDPEFDGRFYQIKGAKNRPHPVQAGGIPLVVLLDRGDPIPSTARVDAIRIAARCADAVVVGGDPASVEEAVEIVRTSKVDGRCEGSDKSVPIAVIWLGPVLVDEVGSAVTGDSATAGIAGGRRTPGGSLSGSPALVAEEVRARLRAGADGCIVSIVGSEPLEAIAGYGSMLRDVYASMAARSDGSE
jgi:alkanesulfonate monooxygenase SsuD/methylene tetrahydromethanopterin reductase-like flavin-dependent oxidoreductase (luciferase family)